MIDARLKQDIPRFFRIYQERIETSLSKHLQEAEANIAKAAFAEELPVFYGSLINRIEEEFRR